MRACTETLGERIAEQVAHLDAAMHLLLTDIRIPFEFFDLQAAAPDSCVKFAIYLGDYVPDKDGDGDKPFIAEGDCNDNVLAIKRGNPEIAGNHMDDDCDGLADETADNTPSTDTMTSIRPAAGISRASRPVRTGCRGGLAGHSTAHEHVRVGNKLATLPLIDEALRTGEMSYCKVRAMTRVATPANEQPTDELRFIPTAQFGKHAFDITPRAAS